MGIFGESTSSAHDRAVNNDDLRSQIKQLSGFLDLANQISDQYVERKDAANDGEEEAEEAAAELRKYRSEISACSRQAEEVYKKLRSLY